MGQRMLIVEDDRLLAEAAADYFTGRGWCVYTEENGARGSASDEGELPFDFTGCDAARDGRLCRVP